MVPIAPLLILLYWIFKWSSGSREERIAPRPGVPVARRQRRLVSPGLLRGLWFGMVWFLLLPATVAILLSVAQGRWKSAPLLIVFAAILAPWSFARLVLIPLRQPMLALALLRLPSLAGGRDPRGVAFLAAAWALLRSRKPRSKTLHRITGGLEKQKPLKGAGVAACGLLAAARGEVGKARMLLGGVEQVHPSACPAVAVRVAREWLVVDAAERGDWRSAARLWGHLQPGKFGAPVFRKATGPRSRLTRLIAKVGSRLMRDPLAPGAASVWISWALAPRRLISFARVREALAQESATDRRKRATGARSARGADSLSQAVSAHAAVVRRGADVRPAELSRALKAWDRLFEDPQVMGRIQKRALSLEVPFPERVLFEMRRDVLHDLTLASAEGRIPLRLLPANGLGLEITDSLRGDLLSEVERAATALYRRLEARQELPASEELAEVFSVRASCERASIIGGEELRRIAFSIVEPAVTNHAVWLYNVREQKPIANAIMQWLLSEAQAVGDAQGIELHQKNVAIGI